MYTFLSKCHSTSISFPDSDKSSMFLSKCQLSAPALIIKTRSKLQQRNCKFASKESSIPFYFKIPGSFFISFLFSLLLKKIIISFFLSVEIFFLRACHKHTFFFFFPKIWLCGCFRTNLIKRIPTYTSLAILILLKLLGIAWY